MKVLLTGSNGQLGKSIIKLKPIGVDIISTRKNNRTFAGNSVPVSMSSISMDGAPLSFLQAGKTVAIRKVSSSSL